MENSNLILDFETLLPVRQESWWCISRTKEETFTYIRSSSGHAVRLYAWEYNPSPFMASSLSSVQVHLYRLDYRGMKKRNRDIFSLFKPSERKPLIELKSHLHKNTNVVLFINIRMQSFELLSIRQKDCRRDIKNVEKVRDADAVKSKSSQLLYFGFSYAMKVCITIFVVAWLRKEFSLRLAWIHCRWHGFWKNHHRPLADQHHCRSGSCSQPKARV